MFNIDTNEIELWFKTNLVMPIAWNLDHDNDVPPGASSEFSDYKNHFKARGYKVWDIQNKQHATTYLELTSRLTGASTLISGRADYLISFESITKAQYLNQMLCVVEIQSKENEELCIMQMLVYLLILMNTKNLEKLVGFLVLTNGQCRAFKASRSEDGDCVYEQNDLFHVAYIVDIFENILNGN